MLAGVKPPTTNRLLSDERTRLIRSARKLGAVMGTTPLLVDPDGPAPELHIVPLGGREGTSVEIILPVLKQGASEDSRRSSKREGVIFTVSSHMSTSTLDSGETDSPQPAVAKLSLSQEARNSLNSVTRLRLVLTLTQPSLSTGPYLSHRDSTDSIDTLTRSLSVLISAPTSSTPDHVARRQKMVKLVNMLGGPIPPSMVFPPPSKTQSRTDRAAKRRSRSVPPTATAPASPPPPRKLVRPPPAPDEVVLPALSVDDISRPRPLTPYIPARTPSPSFGTTSGVGRSRSVTPLYGLRRHTRDSKYGSES